MLSMRNSLPILPSCASGKRKRSRNKIDANIPGLVKYVFIISPKLLNTSVMLPVVSDVSFSGSGIMFLWYMNSIAIISAVVAKVALHAVVSLPKCFPSQLASMTSIPELNTVAIL